MRLAPFSTRDEGIGQMVGVAEAKRGHSARRSFMVATLALPIIFLFFEAIEAPPTGFF